MHWFENKAKWATENACVEHVLLNAQSRQALFDLKSCCASGFGQIEFRSISKRNYESPNFGPASLPDCALKIFGMLHFKYIYILLALH